MMAASAHYTPVVRALLLAALATPQHTLVRARGGFVAFTHSPVRSEPLAFPTFTRRAINMLEREGLAEFDSPDCPAAITLTRRGLAAARDIKDARLERRKRA
jgi:hypothetical protein